MAAQSITFLGFCGHAYDAHNRQYYRKDSSFPLSFYFFLRMRKSEHPQDALSLLVLQAQQEKYPYRGPMPKTSSEQSPTHIALRLTKKFYRTLPFKTTRRVPGLHPVYPARMFEHAVPQLSVPLHVTYLTTDTVYVLTRTVDCVLCQQSFASKMATWASCRYASSHNSSTVVSVSQAVSNAGLCSTNIFGQKQKRNKKTATQNTPYSVVVP